MQDFSAMAQQAPTEDFTEEEIEGAAFSSEDFETMGMPGGDDLTSVKQRIMMLVEQAGLLEVFEQPADKQKLAVLIDDLAVAMVEQDLQKIQANQLFQLIKTTMEESGGVEQLQGAAPEQVQEEPAATKDFASMMPPSGGGLPGR
jgi:hypothetical protein